jgi:hypothetical protein
MRDDSVNVSENDDSDGGDEDGDDDGDSETSGSPAKRIKLDADVPPLPAEFSIPEIPPPSVASAVDHLTRPGLALDDRTKSDSPLKQVSVASPAPSSPVKEAGEIAAVQEAAPEPEAVPEDTPLQESKRTPEPQAIETPPPIAEPEAESAPINPTTAAIHRIDVEMQKEVPELAPQTIPEPPPAPTEEVVQSVAKLRKEEEEEEVMLLDINEQAEELLEHRVAPAPEDLPAPVVEEPSAPPVAAPLAETEAKPPVVQEPVAQDDGEESDTDLLGDLEKSLGN